MSDVTQGACDKIAVRASRLAEDADVEQLKTLAEAVAQVHFGPQGAEYNNRTHYDYHATTHDSRTSRGTGFGARKEGET